MEMLRDFFSFLLRIELKTDALELAETMVTIAGDNDVLSV